MIKFIILSHPRTGSSFLRESLNSFMDVEGHMELFNIKFIDNPSMIKSPINYIKKFYNTTPSLSAKGFKLHYGQAHRPDLEKIWPYLIGEKGIKIIRLKRINILRLYVSLCKSKQTQNWNGFSELQRRKNKIKLEIGYNKCLHAFKEFTNTENDYYNKFKHHPMISINYEELVQNYYGVMTKIKKFLNSNSPIPKSTIQVKKMKLYDEIKNYQQLKDKFKDSKWEYFFED